MTSKTLIYFGVLLIALVAAAILLNRGVARGVVLNTDIGLSTDATSYIVGWYSLEECLRVVSRAHGNKSWSLRGCFSGSR